MESLIEGPVLRLKRKYGESVPESLALELGASDESDAKRTRNADGRGFGSEGVSARKVVSFVRVKTVSATEYAEIDEGIKVVDAVPLEKFTCNGVPMKEEVSGEESNANSEEFYDLFVMTTKYEERAASWVVLEDPNNERYFLDCNRSDSIADESDTEGTVDYPSTPEMDGNSSDEADFEDEIDSTLLTDRLRERLGIDDSEEEDDDDLLYTAHEYLHGWNGSEEEYEDNLSDEVPEEDEYQYEF